MNISVKTASHTYEVVIGHHILAQAFANYKQLFDKADQIIVLTDKHVWQAQEKYFTESSFFAFKNIYYASR